MITATLIYLAAGFYFLWLYISVLRDSEELAGSPRLTIVTTGAICVFFWPVIVAMKVQELLAGESK